MNDTLLTIIIIIGIYLTISAVKYFFFTSKEEKEKLQPKWAKK